MPLHDVRPLPPNSLRAAGEFDYILLEKKVRHEHIAGLGAITVPTSATDRIAFWRRLHDRLSALSNWIVDEQSKILGADQHQAFLSHMVALIKVSLGESL